MKTQEETLLGNINVKRVDIPYSVKDLECIRSARILRRIFIRTAFELSHDVLDRDPIISAAG